MPLGGSVVRSALLACESYMNSPLWVFFDTGTKKPYYQDVHNVLAMPRSAVARYNYRKGWLSNDALSAAEARRTGQAVIVYMQHRQYEKGGQPPGAPYSFDDFVWVATRLANLEHIVQSGNNFDFDLRLDEYPRVSQTHLAQLLRPLFDAGETPSSKWVALSPQTQLVDVLREGGDRQNWPNIVDVLSSHPSQLAGDAFWRLEGPYSTGGENIVPRHERSLAAHEVRGVDALYTMPERSRFRFNVHVHTPPVGGANEQRTIRITEEEGESLAVVHPREVELRRYGQSSIEIKSRRFEELDTLSSMLRFSTEPTGNDWPTGANFRLIFEVQKNKLRTVLGALAIVLGAGVFLTAATMDTLSVTARLLCGIGGACAGMLGCLLIWGKLK